ncbi:MAG: hypothetical protein N2712_05955 [Brevinematales bacterium]|nr:hypothetical protein [Brevinematales bacterium]
MKNKSILEVVFEEKVVVYAMLPFLISFSFFGIITEVVKKLSSFQSPFFYWYPIYFVFIIPFSIYTNSSMFAGGKFIRSIFETLFEILLLLVFNFIFLKGFSFERNIGMFLDINFGISVLFWMMLRIYNGHIVRILNFPYEVLTITANSLAMNSNIEEVFEEKFFEKKSVKNAIKSLFATLIISVFILSISLILSKSNIITISYVVVFVLASAVLIINISKVFLVEDAFVKKIQINNIDFMNFITKFSFVSIIVVIISSIVLSFNVYLVVSNISAVINSFVSKSLRDVINNEQHINEEEIRKIRERLMSESITNELSVQTNVRSVQTGRNIGWGLFLFLLQILFFGLSLIIVIGFILKKLFGVKDIPILSFFVKVYEIFVYFVGKIFDGIRRLFLLLFYRKRKYYIPEQLEEELLKVMQVQRNEISEEKVEEIKTIVRIFIDMLSYTSYVLPYRRSMGVEEYCDSLKNFLPEFSKHLEFISEIVNESRYSNHLLPPSSVEEFKKKVDEIISKIRIRIKVVEDFRGA